MGLSDQRIAVLTDGREADVRAVREAAGVTPVYKRVDTCAAEFEAHTPYLYSTYEEECEAQPTDKRKVIILGGGPNRIGQGIEFDYCCVHAVMALREEGFETIMVNCNPETVSTDYDTSDRLYFEPLTLEDVLAICRLEKPVGVIVQFGGQTPLKLAVPLEKAGVPLLGTGADAIDRAEDRERFGELLAKLDLQAPRWGMARSLEEAEGVAGEIGYPVMVRPSYVLGGRAMERIYDAPGPARLLRASPGAAACRCSSISSWPTRSSSTSTWSATRAATWWSAASWSTSRRPASTRATRPARCRPTRSTPRCSTRSGARPGPSAASSAWSG